MRRRNLLQEAILPVVLALALAAPVIAPARAALAGQWSPPKSTPKSTPKPPSGGVAAQGIGYLGADAQPTGRVLVRLREDAGASPASTVTGAQGAMSSQAVLPGPVRDKLSGHSASAEVVVRSLQLDPQALTVREASAKRGLVSVRIPGGEDAAAFLDKILALPQVEAASIVYRRQYLLPGETRLHSLDATPPGDAGWAVEMVRAPQAWHLSTGEGVAVAVLDTGINPGYAGIAPSGGVSRVVGGIDYIHRDDDSAPVEGIPYDDNGHGTWVSTVVAGSGDEGLGSYGIAPGALIMPVKVLDEKGMGSDDDVIDAINWVVDQKELHDQDPARGADVRVISMSLGSVGAYAAPLLFEEMSNAVREALGAGISVVAAAGNASAGNSGVMFPARVPQVIAAGAVTSTGVRWGSGSSSSGSCYGPEVDLAAPGASVPLLESGPGGIWVGTYGSGTSFACPAVSGTLALLYAMEPGLTPRQAEWLLEKTAVDAGPAGLDDEYGYGVVDAAAAVSLLSSVGSGPGSGSGSGPGSIPAYLAHDAREPEDDAPQSATSFSARFGAGGLEMPGDVDFFRFTLTGEEDVLIRLDPVDSGSETPGAPGSMEACDLVLRLYSGDNLDELGGLAPGSLLAEADHEGQGGPEVIGRVLPPGAYFLSVSEFNAHWFEGAYSLGLSSAGAVALTVRLPLRSPGGFARVTVSGPGVPSGGTVFPVSSDGVALLTGLGDGEHAVSVEAPGHVAASASFSVAGGTVEGMSPAGAPAGTSAQAPTGTVLEVPRVANCLLSSLEYGDVDGDGRVCVRDVVSLGRRLGLDSSLAQDGWNPAWDADGDGRVTLIDLRQVYFGLD